MSEEVFRAVARELGDGPKKNGGPLAGALHRETRGALILVFANDPGPRQLKRAQAGPVDSRDFATLFSYALPQAAEPLGRIGFRVKQSGTGAMVDAN
ncbi:MULTISPECIES: hypothetical protein [unclassified Rhodococcus (in: high G+C Gram-positive bacteria)]|uniref:hypothetical protein n=1 Tax=unclassified Rhodococcus (in: high G+C Gram-positive bacteria) TaxID=192944 RepID=UPI001F5B3772|nr:MULTISPECIES: hypothetical protein [unclassified Rhodococcus (in: high G+C Gram-positive bacteria)]